MEVVFLKYFPAHSNIRTNPCFMSVWGRLYLRVLQNPFVDLYQRERQPVRRICSGRWSVFLVLHSQLEHGEKGQKAVEIPTSGKSHWPCLGLHVSSFPAWFPIEPSGTFGTSSEWICSLIWQPKQTQRQHSPYVQRACVRVVRGVKRWWPPKADCLMDRFRKVRGRSYNVVHNVVVPL